MEPTAEDLHSLIELFDLHPLAVEDALDDNQLPKIDDLPKKTSIIFNAFSYSTNKANVEEIDFS